MEEQIKMAIEAREKSHCPYSKFATGCVLKTKNGKYYTGCNIENVGVQSICSERVAFCKAISEGEYEFESILIVGGKQGEKITEKCLPCGYCRQFINEFVDENFKIYSYDGNENYEYKIKDLLPEAFEEF